MKFISYLNMHRSRLGYVNCVLLAAEMQLDTAAGLRRRLDDLLFRPIFQDSPEFPQFASLLTEGALEQADRQATQRSSRRAKRLRQGVVSESPWRGPRVYDTSELWLLQRDMRSHVGKVLREDSNEPIELAKDLALLSPSYAITEFGHMLKLLIVENVGEPPGIQNPLIVYDDTRLRVLYLLTLLRADIVFAAMLGALSRQWDTNTALQRALDDLITNIENHLRLDEVSEAKDLFALRERIQRVRVARQGAAERPVDKAQRVPRLEFCVDLGLLERLDGNQATEEGTYRATDALRRVPTAFGGLLSKPAAISQWLDREFFGAAGLLYEHELRDCLDRDLSLYYFVKGGAFLKRRAGFIPGRIAATLGCLFAWLEGWRLEIDAVFREVYRVPKGPWADYLHFSGGSRLDSEFLVVIDPSFESKLRELVHTAIPRSGRGDASGPI
jgi:hypothetical protein